MIKHKVDFNMIPLFFLSTLKGGKAIQNPQIPPKPCMTQNTPSNPTVPI